MHGVEQKSPTVTQFTTENRAYAAAALNRMAAAGITIVALNSMQTIPCSASYTQAPHAQQTKLPAQCMKPHSSQNQAVLFSSEKAEPIQTSQTEREYIID